MTREEFEESLDLFGDSSFAWGSARENIKPGCSDDEADELIAFADFAEKKKAELIDAFMQLRGKSA
jgi:hypothetical protein